MSIYIYMYLQTTQTKNLIAEAWGYIQAEPLQF